ncbi:MAG: hypothetical protein AB1744_03620, partial [Candidatus Zixiibacteriota bacterium]
MVKTTIRQVLRYSVLVALLLVMVLPLLWMFRVSLFSVGGGIAIGRLFEADFTFTNFVDLFSAHHMGR